MNVYILNGTCEKVAVIETFNSLLWVRRYYEAGQFELYIPADKKLLEYLVIGNYVERDDDDQTMIIERIEITTNVETGDFYIVSGHSAEIILKRRIVAAQTNLSGTAEDGIRQMIRENAIEPFDVRRILPRIILGTQRHFPETINSQITYENLYDSIVSICKASGFGMEIHRTGSQFYFVLVKGLDRSYSQTENSFVVFSPTFDNLINSQYSEDFSNFSNVAYVAGEGTARTVLQIGTNTIREGMNRYEQYVDARDISSNDGEITLATYTDLLRQRGREKLAETTLQKEFAGETIDTTFKFKTDWNVGDIVQIENENGIAAAPRILEVVESFSNEGYKAIPTFETWEA